MGSNRSTNRIDIAAEIRENIISGDRAFSDYFHRIGRTARAGRSGLAISLVSQYEAEWYLLIEKLLNKKLPEFPVKKEEAMIFLERVSEARRRAQMAAKESYGNKKRRRGGDDGGDEEVENFATQTRKSNSSKKSKKR